MRLRRALAALSTVAVKSLRHRGHEKATDASPCRGRRMSGDDSRATLQFTVVMPARLSTLTRHPTLNA
ncbi:hypothetical protein GCM10010286_54890 [Streptomyces toxytricini]|nr:hypothetical protein GCM10010286_54890 [Streptomyces toxytricini]